MFSDDNPDAPLTGTFKLYVDDPDQDGKRVAGLSVVNLQELRMLCDAVLARVTSDKPAVAQSV
jgi:hypothetical protein